MNIEKIYREGLLFHHWANTAYPLTPRSFNEFRIEDKSEIKEFLKQEINKLEELSLYIHIPFCQQRCKFCEYVVVENAEQSIEDEYIALLLKEMQLYKELIGERKIVGFDLGGGTPSKLSEENLTKVTESVKSLFNIDPNVTFSVETTPIIASSNPEKIEMLYKLGYRRMSMGIQTISEPLLNKLGREGTTHIYEKAMKQIRIAGFEDVNIDLMYGFLNQSNDDFERTLRYAITLNPDHITLYRNRYKATKLVNEAGGVSLNKVMQQYRLAYKLLNDNGYKANPGKNTFSRIEGSYGTSDYLTKRVIKGTAYVGMGLGAQSFGNDYLAYNAGAATKQMAQYKKMILAGEFPIQDIYSLPLDESIAKMVSVAFYFAFIDLDGFKKRFGVDFETHFQKEINYLITNKLMERKDGRIQLTERGADYINGIIPLFYSQKSKEEMFKLAEKQQNESEAEKIFLSAYHTEEYKRPSVAVDNVIISPQNEILLIRRGEHTFLNAWALPGGFLKEGERIEEALIRETKEECGIEITEDEFEQVALSSNPKRDPRGWVISCAFYTALKEKKDDSQYGGDAIELAWIPLHKLDSLELAFDHREIIQKTVKL